MNGACPFAEENEGFVTAAQARSLGIKVFSPGAPDPNGEDFNGWRAECIEFLTSRRIAWVYIAKRSCWCVSASGPKKIALSHETALAVYGIFRCESVTRADHSAEECPPPPPPSQVGGNSSC